MAHDFDRVQDFQAGPCRVPAWLDNAGAVEALPHLCRDKNGKIASCDSNTIRGDDNDVLWGVAELEDRETVRALGGYE